MSEPFLAEIRMVGFNFAPRGWALCDGQILPINQNQALFSLLGTTYGGDGRTNFALPDLRGRAPIHMGSGVGLSSRNLGEKSGTETTSLSSANMANHQHSVQATSDNGTTALPGGNLLAAFNNGYRSDAPDLGLSAPTVSAVGGGQAHQNMQPYLAVNFCIALQGLFPSRN